MQQSSFAPGSGGMNQAPPCQKCIGSGRGAWVCVFVCCWEVGQRPKNRRATKSCKQRLFGVLCAGASSFLVSAGAAAKVSTASSKGCAREAFDVQTDKYHFFIQFWIWANSLPLKHKPRLAFGVTMLNFIPNICEDEDFLVPLLPPSLTVNTLEQHCKTSPSAL